MRNYDKLLNYVREIAALESIGATLEWDERTYMPAPAGSYRAEQITCLAGLIHQRQTDPKLGELLRAAADDVDGDDPHGDQASTIRVLTREFEKRTKLPRKLVEALTKNGIEGQQAWVEARRKRNFAILRPFLERTVQLKREQARAVGFEDCMYDALLDDYEPAEKTSRVRDVFATLRQQLASLLHDITDGARSVSTEVLHRHFPIPGQQKIGAAAAAAIGFDFERGRLDVTQHPFCTTLGPRDCRLTTRYDERFFSTGFFGTLHEAGHGIYEQGLRSEHHGLPPGQAASMSIHESQSRLWENLVARGRPYWAHAFPQVRAVFADALRDVDAETFYRAVNEVRPSLIRVEADEVTYNLHIIIRFELEQELIEQRLTAADLPAAWNDRYRDLLGIAPDHDGEGVLQDIHWSAGYFGYFPTYALGNLYAAQFFEKAANDLGDLPGQLARGQFAPLREWLVENIHRHGRCYSADQLVRKVTGQPLSQEPLIRHLRTKMTEVHGI